MRLSLSDSYLRCTSLRSLSRKTLSIPWNISTDTSKPAHSSILVILLPPFSPKMSGRNISASRQQGTNQRPSSNVSNAGTVRSPATTQQGANGGQGYSQTTVFGQGLTDRDIVYQTTKEQERQGGYPGVAVLPKRPVETQEYRRAAAMFPKKSKASKSKLY